MSQVIVILDSNTLTVSDWYFSDSPVVPVTPGIRLEVPDGLTWNDVKGVRSEDGTVTLIEDPIKVQAKLDQAWTALRTERNRRLAETDWVALADAHLSQDKKDAWFAYRQELRDVPESVQNPTDSVVWPLKPGELPPPPPVTASRLDALLEHAGVVEEVQEPVVEAETVQEPVVESTEAEPAPEVTEEPVQEA